MADNKTTYGYKKIYIPQKNITLNVPASKSEEEITQTIKDNWDTLPDKRPDLGTWLGQKLAGGYEPQYSPEWSVKQTAKTALGGAAEAITYGTPLGRVAAFGVPFAAQALSGAAAIPVGAAGGLKALTEGKEFMPTALETATSVIEKQQELVSKIPVIGTPISPVGETVQKAFGLIPEAVGKGIELGQKAMGVEKEEYAQPLREAAAELTSYAIYGILGVKGGKASNTIKKAIVNKYFPNKKPVLNLPTEIYQQRYSNFQDFIAKNNLDISKPDTRAFAVKAYNDTLTVQRAAAKEATRQAKKAMTDVELKKASEAVKNNRMTLDDWRDLQEFKKKEYQYNIFEEAVKRGDIAKEEVEGIRQELIEQLRYEPQEVKPKTEPVKVKPEQERLQAIREELIRQADEAKDKVIKEARTRQLERLDRLIEQKYGKKSSELITTQGKTQGKSIEYRFAPDTRAGEFYDRLISTGFSKERAEHIVNTVYPEAPKIEVVEGYKVREAIRPEATTPEEVIPEEITKPEIVKPEAEAKQVVEELKITKELSREPTTVKPEDITKIAEPEEIARPEVTKPEAPRVPKTKKDLTSIKAESELEAISKLEEHRNSIDPKETPEPLTITTPTSEFTIYSPTKDVISSFISKLKSAIKDIPKTKAQKKKVTTALANRKHLEEAGIGYCNPYKVRTPDISIYRAKNIYKTKDGFVTFNNFYAIKLDAKLAKEVHEISKKTIQVTDTDRTIQSLLTPNPKPVSIIAETKLLPDDISLALTYNPKTPSEYHLFNPHYIDYTLKRYPNAKTFLHDDRMLEFRDNDKPVAILMEIKSEETLNNIKTAFSSHIEELKQSKVLKEPENRTTYVDSLSSTSSPTIEEVQKAELKKTNKKSKLPDIQDIIDNEKGELVTAYRSVESVLQDLGVTFKQLPGPLEYFKGIKGDIRKKIMLNDTIARIFPHVREHMDILDQIERLPNKFKFEEYKSLQPFFSLKNPEKVYRFIESLRRDGKTRTEYPLTEELLNSKGFTEAEKSAIRAIDSFTYRAMDYYIRRTLLNHARLDGEYQKPMNYTEAQALVKYLIENNESPHIIKQAKAIAEIHGKVDGFADYYYFPASRYGKYYILAKTEDGKTAYLTHVDKKRNIPEVVKQLKQEHPEWKISAGENYKPRTELAYELPPHILSVVKAAIEDLEKAGTLTLSGKDLLVELERMSAKWKGSFAVHLLNAELIPGWEKDLKKSIADYAHKMSKTYVYSEYIPKFREAIAKLDLYNDAPLIELLKKNLDDITSSQYKFRSVNKFMFTYYLSGNFKSALINLTQPVTMTFPWSTKYVSVPEASRMFPKAYKDAMNYRLKRYKAIDPELKVIMDELIEREVLMAQGVREMMGYRESVSGLRTSAQSIFEFLSILFKEAEIMNRYHAASMFYQIGKKKGLRGEELLRFTEREGVNMTQFDYSTMGLPQIARGSLRPLFIFRLFTINWLSRAKQLLREGEYKSFAMLLGSHFLLGGIAGVPLSMELFKAIHWAYNKLSDRDEAFETDMRAFTKNISEEYGDNLADFIQYGLPSVAGITISGSINPIEIGTLDTQHPVYGLIKTVTGVAPDIAVRATRAYNIWKRHSNAYRAVETMMPEFIRNTLVAYRWYAEKGASHPNGEIIFTPNLFQIALKGLGFNPSEYILALNKEEVIKNMIRESKIKTANINERLGLALARGDMDTFTKIIEAVVTQNIKYIEQGQMEKVINIDDGAVKAHMLKVLNPEAYRMARTPRRMRPKVRKIEEAYEEEEE